MNITLGACNIPFTPWRPADGRIFNRFAYDTETTDIDDDHPYITPTYVLGAACDEARGVYISRDNLVPFFAAHAGVPFVCHNAAFDLRVSDLLLRPGGIDLYAAVEAGSVWDTLILQRLYTLATAGHTARGESSLAHCAKQHLGLDLDKDQTDANGEQVRTSWGQFLGKPLSNIPWPFLTYLARDAIATWQLFDALHALVRETLQSARDAFGFVDDDWLRDRIARFGPLTHHIQLRASIVVDVLRANGIGIDQARREEKLQAVQEVVSVCRERLRLRGYLPGEKGCQKALQKIIEQAARAHPEVSLRRSESGKLWSTAEEDLHELAMLDEFFVDFALFRAAQKLESTYLDKMTRPRLHPKFGYLLETGRTYCGGGFNLQNLPREAGEKNAARTIRGSFAPAPGHVFIDSDYSQIELVVLGHAIQHQFREPSVLAELVNSGLDVHRLIAGRMLGKDSADVTKAERNSVKPVSFGRPGGMGAETLQKIAKAGYGIDMTTEQVDERIQAYHQLCPELDAFLTDEIDSRKVVARELGLTLAQFYGACGRYCDRRFANNHQPIDWLGGMLLKVLRDEQPLTRNGHMYSPEELDFFWEAAQRLPVKLKPELATKLHERLPGRDLWSAVRNWAGRRPVFTLTGRLRANCTFCSARNNIFQGPAADGAILALWRVWRAGYELVDFVHDQLVVESSADDKVPERIAHIETLMKEGMLEIVPGMLVKVETVVTRSLNKNDLDPRYSHSTEPTKEIPNDPATTAA